MVYAPVMNMNLPDNPAAIFCLIKCATQAVARRTARLLAVCPLNVALVICLGVCASLPAQAAVPETSGATMVSATVPKQGLVPQMAIAMHGEPLYQAGFEHFAYTNPEAPKGGTFTLGVRGSFDSLNPFIIMGQTPYGLNTGTFSLVYETLLARGWDEPFTLYGLLAQSVEMPPDRSEIIFNLNPLAHWQDGRALTADDVLFSFYLLRDKGRPNHRSYYAKVEKAEKLGLHKVRFVFKRGPEGETDRELPLIMGLMPIVPQHIWENENFNATTTKFPVGSGPYQVEKMDLGRSITYVRDPDYWGSGLSVQKGLYNFERIKIDFYRDENAIRQAVEAGLLDLHRESDANKWAEPVPEVLAGRLIKQEFQHHRTEPIRGFILNTRHPLLDDPLLRHALMLTFDSGWINRVLFNNQMKRAESFFPNSELAATGLPHGAELDLLRKYQTQLPAEIFTQNCAPPATDGTEQSLRQNLLLAAKLLKKGGYVYKEGKLYAPKTGQNVRFEILLNDPQDEKLALVWARALARVGIGIEVREVDSAQYQRRLTEFDYDITINGWFNSLSPGNEQNTYWGTLAAGQKGSRNYAGVENPVIDALIKEMTISQTRAQLVAAVRALDRVLLFGDYVVPFFYAGKDRIEYWANKVAFPQNVSLYGPLLESWWQMPEKIK